MRGRSLHAALLCAAVALCVAVPTAIGADPQGGHFFFSGTETQDDFCGTGQSVEDTYAIHLNVWNAPNQPVDTRNQSESTVVFTNPANGDSVTVHNAYSFTDALISGDPNGLNLHEWIFKGNAELIRGSDGGVLGHDKGQLVVDATWNGPEFAGGEIVDLEFVTDRGGHALFASGDCGVLMPALGLG
jgi:hypothetical protein